MSNVTEKVAGVWFSQGGLVFILKESGMVKTPSGFKPKLINDVSFTINADEEKRSKIAEELAKFLNENKEFSDRLLA